MKIALSALNALPPSEFTTRLCGIFEHSPWVAAGVADGRPFASVAALHTAMVAIVDTALDAQKLALLCAHPELARRGPLTAESASEQGSKGLGNLEATEAAVFDALNSAYRARFGFPFIIAVRGQRDRAAIRAAMELRVQHSAEQELSTALAEVAKIARFRLEDLIENG